MLSFTGSLKVFVALDPVDMRKGFEGLHAAVSEKLKADVRDGAIFAVPSFLNYLDGCLTAFGSPTRGTRGSRCPTGTRPGCG